MAGIADLAVSPGGRPISYAPLGPKALWRTKGLKVPDYIRGVARGINPADPESAIDEAVSAIKRWALTSKNPSVRAAAAKALAEWEAAKAAAHALSTTNQRSIDLAETHIYHWKHGWIPLTHEAALSKAHGSHAGASRLLTANGQHEDAQRMLARGLSLAPQDSKRRSAYRSLLASHMRTHGTLIGPNPTTRRTVPSVPAGIHIEHTGDGTLVHGTSRGDGSSDVLKQQGFRWSSNLNAWYLPRTQHYSTRSMKVDNAERELKTAGHDVAVTREAARSTTAAERETERKSRSAARAERLDARAARLTAEADRRHDAARAVMDRIPMGQPILIGHHSERGHRADLKRIDNNISKSLEAQAEAQDSERRAEAARRNATGNDGPLLRQRRIDRTEAEIRKIDRRLKEHEIAVKAPKAAASVGVHPLPDSYLEQLRTTRAELVDQVEHDRSQIAASGHQGIRREDIKPGDVIHYRGRTHVVKKVNKTTISVPTGYSWDDKVPINQITGHKRAADLSSDAQQPIDLAAVAHTYHFKHGWIPLDGDMNSPKHLGGGLTMIPGHHGGAAHITHWNVKVDGDHVGQVQIMSAKRVAARRRQPASGDMRRIAHFESPEAAARWIARSHKPHDMSTTQQEVIDLAMTKGALPPLPGSSKPRFPINNHADLKKAVKAVGRAKTGHAAIRRHIIARAKAIGGTHLLPANWTSTGNMK